MGFGDAVSSTQKLPFSLSFPKPISTNANQRSMVFSYLKNTCGLSPKSALSVSKEVHFKTPEKPDLVLNVFKHHGFSQTQISKIIEKAPTLLVRKPEKTLLPKFVFFRSLGISGSDLAALVSTSPGLLLLGLHSKIVPNFNALAALFQSKDKATAAIKRMPTIFYTNVAKTVATLHGHGVPDDELNQTIERVNKMGISPREASWKGKVNHYKSWGLSEERVMAAFAKRQGCMKASEGKISAMMDFLVNKMGLEASYVAERPQLICYSLEKRYLPRASVIQFLISNGLLEQKDSRRVARMLECSEKAFKRKCLTCLKGEPQLLKLCRDKFDLFKVRKRSVSGKHDPKWTFFFFLLSYNLTFFTLLVMLSLVMSD